MERKETKGTMQRGVISIGVRTCFQEENPEIC